MIEELMKSTFQKGKISIDKRDKRAAEKSETGERLREKRRASLISDQLAT